MTAGAMDKVHRFHFRRTVETDCYLSLCTKQVQILRLRQHQNLRQRDSAPQGLIGKLAVN